MCLDDIKELIKQRNLLTKQIDELSKPVDVLLKVCTILTKLMIEKNKEDEGEVRKAIQAQNDLTGGRGGRGGGRGGHGQGGFNWGDNDATFNFTNNYY